jgi:hypothetical protein
MVKLQVGKQGTYSIFVKKSSIHVEYEGVNAKNAISSWCKYVYEDFLYNIYIYFLPSE